LAFLAFKKFIIFFKNSGGQEEELEDIPAYVIKSGSTASITCELNSDCVAEGVRIEVTTYLKNINFFLPVVPRPK